MVLSSAVIFSGAGSMASVPLTRRKGEVVADRVPGPVGIGYLPGALLAVAGGVEGGLPLTTLARSPLTKPVMLSVNVGLAAPYVRRALPAVTVSVAGFTRSDTVAVAPL